LYLTANFDNDFIKYQNYEADIVMTFYLSLKKR